MTAQKALMHVCDRRSALVVEAARDYVKELEAPWFSPQDCDAALANLKDALLDLDAAVGRAQREAG